MTAWLNTSAVLATLVTAPAVSLPVWFYLRMKADLRKAVEQLATRDELRQAKEPLESRLLALEARDTAAVQSRQEHDAWLAEAESLNLNRRGQVLRLHRRGDSVRDIASALRVGPGEVSLIIKVYELSKAPEENQ